VEKILEDLGLKQITLLRVFNKMDKVDSEKAQNICLAYEGVCLSALDPKTFSSLLEKIDEKLTQVEARKPNLHPSFEILTPSPQIV
jgi:50S ribosomal subunit-associated GTPase HflX